MWTDGDGTAFAGLPDPARMAIWIALVAASSVVFSLALACVTPFVALATISAWRMTRRDAVLLVLVAWLANQAVGYGVLGYPRTWDSFAWGASIGVAAVLAMLAAHAVARSSASVIITVAMAFAAAFVVYQAALFASTAVLPSGDDAFSLATIILVLRINVLALAGLLVLHRLAIMIGLLSAAPKTAHAA